LNSEDLNKRDAEFFKVFAKDKTINRATFNAEWAKKHQTKKPAFKCGFEIAAPTPEHKKIYDVLKQYCDKFPAVKTPNIVLCGATGTGKTFAANIITQNLKSKGFDVQFTTAFAMVNAFQKYVNSWGRDFDSIDDFLSCDMLIIDDLGAEPTIKNITQEHICNILNERLSNGRAFIITTNLAPAAIIERYDQRIASRILSKETSTLIEFKGKDLRLN